MCAFGGPDAYKEVAGGFDEIELSLGLPLSKLYSDLQLQTKAMLETQRQAAIASHQHRHTASGAAEDSVHREACKAKGRVVRLMLAKGEPGGTGWAGGLCQPRQESGEGSGPVIGHLHDAELEAPQCGAGAL